MRVSRIGLLFALLLGVCAGPAGAGSPYVPDGDGDGVPDASDFSWRESTVYVVDIGKFDDGDLANNYMKDECTTSR